MNNRHLIVAPDDIWIPLLFWCRETVQNELWYQTRRTLMTNCPNILDIREANRSCSTHSRIALFVSEIWQQVVEESVGMRREGRKSATVTQEGHEHGQDRVWSRSPGLQAGLSVIPSVVASLTGLDHQESGWLTPEAHPEDSRRVEEKLEAE